MTRLQGAGPFVSVQSTTRGGESPVRAALQAIGFRDRVRSDHTVLVKPNYSWATPKPGVTTNPEILEAALACLKDRASRVLVGEADGGFSSFRAEEAFRRHGLAAICARTGAEPVNLSERPPVRVERKVLGRRVEVRLDPLVHRETDVTVSVPVMKTHLVTTVSLGLKNLWGCDSDGMRLLRRKYLSRRLALIAQELHAGLTVVDATVAQDGRGPIYGRPVPVGLVIAGNDPVATDAATAHLMGFDPRRIEHIRTAHRAGVGTADLDKITLDYKGPVPVHPFHTERKATDYLVLLSFRSTAVAKLCYDSPLTPALFRAVGKRPKRGTPRPRVEPGGERD